MPLHPPVPILRVFDEAMALGFYVEYLGFHLDWRHVFEEDMPVYMQVSRDGCVLHLTEHFGDATPGARLRARVDDLAGLHAEVTARAYRYLRPGIQDTPWGDMEMTLTDPFGNRITFYERPEPGTAGTPSSSPPRRQQTSVARNPRAWSNRRVGRPRQPDRSSGSPPDWRRGLAGKHLCPASRPATTAPPAESC